MPGKSVFHLWKPDGRHTKGFKRRVGLYAVRLRKLLLVKHQWSGSVAFTINLNRDVITGRKSFSFTVVETEENTSLN